MSRRPATMEPVSTPDAPPAGGAYSQAIKAGGFVFAAGQLARDPATGQLIEGDAKAQTERVLENLAAVLAAAGTGMDRAVKTTVFLRSLGDFPAMNEAYAKFFTGAAPARTTVQAALPGRALVEIDVVALAWQRRPRGDERARTTSSGSRTAR